MIVDQAEALEYIDQLRVTIPEEIKSARRVNAEVERLLEQARAEAEQILARAQEQATYLIEERELTRQAEEISQEMIRQAESDSAEIMRGADNYSAEVLSGLESEVMRTLKTIRRGLEVLDERRAIPEEAEAETEEGELDEYDQSGTAQPIRG